MIIVTQNGAVDLSRVNGFMKSYDHLDLYGQGELPRVRNSEDQLLVEFFFQNPVITGDTILELADAIASLRENKCVEEERDADLRHIMATAELAEDNPR